MITLIPLLLSALAVSYAGVKCPTQLEWEVTKVGHLKADKTLATDFIFLSDNQFLVANLPKNNKDSAPLQIYTKSKNGWDIDDKATARLPKTWHARHLVMEDVTGDKDKEVLIADHGPDLPPFPGAHPLIIKNEKGQWLPDSSNKDLGTGFTFNVVGIPLPDGGGAIYKANVGGRGPVFFSYKKDKWENMTSTLPAELSRLCMMTALVDDFDKNGTKDIYLGGCDRPNEMPEQKNDRILSLVNNKWELQPQDTIPARKEKSSWGTVFVKTVDLNSDNKPDLIVGTHDFGFHAWKVAAYENLSTPGKFKFREIVFPLKQEEKTEGFVYGIEDFKVKGHTQGFFVGVRSVMRDPKSKFPSINTRFLLQDKNNFVDASKCVPEELRRTTYLSRKIPGDPYSVLMVPFEGDILKVSVKSKVSAPKSGTR